VVGSGVRKTIDAAIWNAVNPKTLYVPLRRY
jgi:hypothetical protein